MNGKPEMYTPKNNRAEYKSRLESESEDLLSAVSQDKASMAEYYVRLARANDMEQFSDEVEEKLSSYKRANANLIKACAYIVASTGELSARYSDLSKGKKRKRIPSPPANFVIDMEENQKNSFARGLNFYKLFLICFIGSFVGVIIEMLWCLLKNGYIESRAGLVIGPFNLLYGVGAVALTLALYRFRNNRKWLSFAGGMIVGSVVEYICSFLQEIVFGSRSWDYSEMPFNINGRICLLYSVFWGLLGVLWVKTLYPWTAKLILKISDEKGKAISWVLFAFLIFNAILTVLCVWRWSQRIADIPSANGLWSIIDALFPNERMESVFANMVFG